MEINSIPFLLFFVVVFTIYYICNKHAKAQNIILLLASYFFYGYADWKMLPVIAVMTVIFYFLGIKIGSLNGESERKTKYWLTTFTVIIGLLPLLYFKYFNFFVKSFADLFSSLGLQTNYSTFKIIMPLGISFFTFRLISYAVEINRGKMQPTKDFIAFATYIAFFPSLMAGPIDRPNKFLPQLAVSRKADYNGLVEGFKRIIWGWFMKVCVADRMGEYVDAVMNNFAIHNGTSLLVASLLYPMQMYADFGGYSNMAIGVGKMLGITITENFNRPFFAQNVAEYWRRWHISLTSWLTDYVFMPLNIRFRDWGKWGLILAVTINFVLIGFWHGANWTFGFFGLYYGLLYIPLVLNGKMNKKTKIKWIALKGKRTSDGTQSQNGYLISPKNLSNMLCTYLLVALGLIFFRSANMTDAFSVVKTIFTSVGVPFLTDRWNTVLFLFGTAVLCANDWLEECKSKYGILKTNKSIILDISLIVMIIYILMFRGDAVKEFIYQQF